VSSTGDDVTLGELLDLAARLSELRARTAIPAIDTALRHAEHYLALARIGLGDSLLAPWCEDAVTTRADPPAALRS